VPRPPFYDDHVHSLHSADSQTPVLAICQAAAIRGLRGLCLTDHFDTDPNDWGYGHYDWDMIVRSVDQARAIYGEQLALQVGAEVCFQPCFSRRVADFLAACPLDYALGSVHYVQREFVHPDYFRRRSPHEAYARYFAAVEELVTSGLFDALGHLDLAKRYAHEVCGPFDPSPHWEQIERILRLMAGNGMALEVNTSGWRQGPAEPFPGEAIVRRFVELGGTRITLGSDAHLAADVGRDLVRALDLLRSAGLTHITRYVQRQPVLIPIGA
jgi:histidinol-phosphatase (PHP family)